MIKFSTLGQGIDPDEIMFSLQKNDAKTLCTTAEEDELNANSSPENLGGGYISWVDPAYTGPITSLGFVDSQENLGQYESIGHLSESCVFFVCENGNCDARPKTIRWWVPFLGVTDTLQRVIYAYQTFEDCAKACGCNCPVEGTQKYVVSNAIPPCDCCGPDSYGANEGGSIVCKCSDSKPGYQVYELPWTKGSDSGTDYICCNPTMEGTISTDPLKIDCKCKNPSDTRFDIEAGSVCCGTAIMGTTGETVNLAGGPTQKEVNGSMRTIPECQCPTGGAYGNTKLYKTQETGTQICCPDGFKGQDVSGVAKCVSKWYCDGNGGCSAQQPGQQIVINGQTMTVGGADGQLIGWDTEAECKAAGCGGQYCSGDGNEPAQCTNVTWENFVRGNPLSQVKMMSAADCSAKCGKYTCASSDPRYPVCIRLDQSITSDYNSSYWASNNLFDSQEGCAMYCEVRWSCSGSNNSYDCVSVPVLGSFGSYATPEDCCGNCESCGRTDCGGAGQNPCCPQGQVWDGSHCKTQ